MSRSDNDVAVGYQAALADIANQILAGSTPEEQLDNVMVWVSNNLKDFTASAMIDALLPEGGAR